MIWMTADLHLSHMLMVVSRKFNSKEEMNHHVIDQINKYVSEKDTLYILGDICWGDPAPFIKRIKCKNTHLIFGNHDKRRWGQHFKTSQDVLDLKVKIDDKTQRIFMSHYAHAFWPKSHRSSMEDIPSWHAYGHTHGEEEEFLNKILPERYSVDVGLDNAFRLYGELRPFCIEDLQEIFKDRVGHHWVDGSYKEIKTKYGE